MAITTTDVVTNVVSGVEIPKNATTVVYCLPTGSYKTLDAVYETSLSYNSLEGSYTDRFYNNIDSLRTVDGGNV
jgi:hypothetical protein